MPPENSSSQAFKVTDSTLECLEWSRLVDRLRACCRTPIGTALLAEYSSTGLFELRESGVRARQAETSEVRALLDADAMPPIGGCADVRIAVAQAEKGGVLDPTELLEVRATLNALHATIEFFDRRRDEAPRLFELAEELHEANGLEAEIARCLNDGGEVKDSASSTLAQARRDANRLSGELQSRI